MPERTPPPDLAQASLETLAAWASGQRAPPVERWNPPLCGDSGMMVAGDGRWLHDGAPIRRPEMVRLFASILRRETDASYVLVTPAEKLTIAVEDLPFVATELRTEGVGEERRVALVLSIGETIIVGGDHPLALDGDGRPGVTVRRDLRARIARPVWYELAAIALDEDRDPPGLWSGGAFFALGGAA